MLRRRKLGTAVAALGLATLAFGAGGADAAKLKTRTATVTVPAVTPGAAGTASAIAVCPRGTRVIGGGFLGTYSLSGGIVTQVALPYESYRVGQRRWQVSGENLGSMPQQVTSYAYCRDVPRMAQRSTTTFLPPNPTSTSIGEATARCPRDKKAIAGGFQAQVINPVGGSGAIPLASQRSGSRGWITRASTNISGVSGSITSHVYCLDRPKPRQRSGVTSVSGANAPAAVSSARCPRGTLPGSGGFTSSPQVTKSGPGQNAFLFFESRRAGRRWHVSGLHAQGPTATTSTVTARGYCT